VTIALRERTRAEMTVGETLYIRRADNNDRQRIWDLIFTILSSYGLNMDAETIDHYLTDI